MSEREALKARVNAAIDQRREQIIGLGEAIMDQPELGFKEVRTAQRVKEVLEEAGLSCQDGLALTGVKAVLKGKKPGPTLAMMAIGLLGDDAALARKIKAAHRPALSREDYLAQQRGLFHREVYDGAVEP